MQKKKKSQSYVIELSHSHTAIKDPYDWKWETAAFLDGLLQIGGQIGGGLVEEHIYSFHGGLPRLIYFILTALS